MVAIKAALWASDDTDEFLQKAAKAYQEEIPLKETYCFQCGANTKEILAAYEIPDGRHVVFEHVPTMDCPNCENREWSLRLLAALETASEDLPENTTMTLEQALGL